jgi:hypothetical protein
MNKRQLLIASQVLLLVAILGSFVYYSMIEVESTPCSPGGFPVRCYHITQDVCEVIWKKSEESCKTTVQGLNLSASRLLGPITFKCQLSSLDKAFSNSRKNNEECTEMKKDLDGWRARNPDFRN